MVKARAEILLYLLIERFFFLLSCHSAVGVRRACCALPYAGLVSEKGSYDCVCPGRQRKCCRARRGRRWLW